MHESVNLNLRHLGFHTHKEVLTRDVLAVLADRGNPWVNPRRYMCRDAYWQSMCQGGSSLRYYDKY